MDRRSVQGHPQVEAMAFEGLTVELCKRVGAGFIVRGLRNSTDHGYERSIALTNRQLAGVETIFLPAAPEHAHISSTIVRELLANKADVSALVPMVTGLVDHDPRTLLLPIRSYSVRRMPHAGHLFHAPLLTGRIEERTLLQIHRYADLFTMRTLPLARRNFSTLNARLPH
jgi:hypothetical protein